MILMHARSDAGKLLETLMQLRNPITGNLFSRGYAKMDPMMLYNSGYTSRFEGDTTANGLEQAFNIINCRNFCSLVHFRHHFQYKQWDPGVWAILSDEVPELCVPATKRTADWTSKLIKRTLCMMCNYKLCRPERAIAWGQAMFFGGR